MAQQINLNSYKEIQILGQSAIIFQKAFGENDILIDEFLRRNQIDSFKPDQWYPLEKILRLQYEVQEDVGFNMAYMVGISTANNVQLPPDVDSVEKLLCSLDVVYHLFHGINNKPLFNPSTGEMKEGIGHYKCTLTSSYSAKMIVDTPYPCDFDKGLLTGFSRKFKSLATVELDINVKNRKDGAESSTYLIRW